MTSLRVTVLGAGIVGLAVAEELLRRGHEVRVVDPSPGRGASYAAAGMLTPGGELWHGEEELVRLGRDSVALWPGFAARLGVHLHTTGTLLAGADAGDVQQVERQLALLERAGVRAEPLTGRELRAREPRLGRVGGGAYLPDDHSVDPREVVRALLARVGLDTPSLVPFDTPARPSLATQDKPHDGYSTNDGVVGRVASASERIETTADVTVIATGATLPAPYDRLVRPVHGEILRLVSDDPPDATVRAWVHGEQVYVVPRRSREGRAEVVVGATQEERAEVTDVPTAEGVGRLLERARLLVPGLDRAGFVEATARSRPGSPDNLPLVGPVHEPGVVLAAGHFRHGVLLAPLTARLVADHLETGVVDPALDPRRLPELARPNERPPNPSGTAPTPPARVEGEPR